MTAKQIRFGQSDKFEHFELHGNFLLISCSTCNEGKGEVHFYDSQNFGRIEVGVLSSDSGEESDVTRFGQNVVTKEDALGYLRIYITKTETTDSDDETTERVAIMAL